ncbi:MAG: hypothetical protein MUE81_13465 [Thermoflexibacter sp.]|jgi:hypothetical protein|nr:hypothetical protein [Thermoflexibacter sp.]
MKIQIKLKSLQDEKILVDKINFLNQYNLNSLTRTIQYLGLEQVNNDFIASFDFPEEAKSHFGYIEGSQEPIFTFGAIYGTSIQKSNCSECQKINY